VNRCGCQIRCSAAVARLQPHKILYACSGSFICNQIDTRTLRSILEIIAKYIYIKNIAAEFNGQLLKWQATISAYTAYSSETDFWLKESINQLPNPSKVANHSSAQ